jgi:CubicO group peptidase (beta-lactamase class C family)
MKTIIRIPFFIAALLFVGITEAQITDTVKKELERRIENGDNPSIAIGIYKNNTVDYFVTGYQNMEKKTLATTATIYEIGSITKTFTGLLLSKMVLENKVTLDTPLYAVFPDSLKLSDPEGRKVTFKDVATHTSGLHSFPLGYNPPDLQNPYAQLDRKKLYQYLSNWGTMKVGKKYSYSNIGVGLMGEGLAIIESTPYKTLIKNEILEPLNLNHTYFDVPASQTKNFAYGYQKGKLTSHWDLNILSPAGALKADIKDLVSYGMSYLRENKLSEAQQATIPTQFVSEDGKTEIGVNWFKKESTISHGGGTYGFSAYLGIDLEKEIVVAVLTNTGDQNILDIHSHLVDPENNRLFTKDAKVFVVPFSKLNTYKGIYKDSQYGLTATIMVKDNKLYGQVAGQNALEFTPIAENTFVNNEVKAQMAFKENENEITSFTLSQRGQNIVLKKQ